MKKTWVSLCIVSVFSLVTLMVGVPSAKADTNPNALIRNQMFESSNSAATYAQKVDMYMCHYEGGGFVQQIHALNPAVICLLYRTMREIYQSSPEFQMFYNNGWLLKDIYGNYIKSTAYSSNWIVDPGNPYYQQWVANWLKGYVDQYGFNGVFADCILYGTMGEYLWSTSSGPPKNPRTGQQFTDSEYQAAAIALINKVKETIGSRLVICNGIYDGSRFFNGWHGDYTVVLLGSKMDGLMSEGLFSEEGSNSWYSESKWLDSVNFVVWLENNYLPKGKTFVSYCPNALSYDGYPVLPSGCTQKQYVSYVYSSLLLGAKTIGAHYLDVGLYTTNDYAQSLYSVDVGNPSGSYFMVQGTHIYARDFSKAVVLVNPTYEAYSINLNGDLQTLDGVPVSSPLTVSSHTGIILKKTTPSGQNTQVGFTLSPSPAKPGVTVSLSGTLTDGSGGAVYPAQVKVDYSVDAGVTWNYAWTLNTNTAGGFTRTFTAPAVGQYLFRISYAGSTSYNPSSKTVTLLVQQLTKTGSWIYFGFAPDPAKTGSSVTLQGVLVDATSNSINNAPVTMEYSADDGMSWNSFGTLTTNDKGVFYKTFSAPAVGSYLVKVSYAGDSTHTASSNNAYLKVLWAPPIITAAGSIFFNFLPNPSTPSAVVTLKGILLDGLGTPISSVPVTITYSVDDGATGYYIWTLTTDEYGIFSKTLSASAGTYLIQASQGNSKTTTYLRVQS